MAGVFGLRPFLRHDGPTLARISRGTPPTLARLARRLRAGDLVAVPTETVYGLAATRLMPEPAERFSPPRGVPR